MALTHVEAFRCLRKFQAELAIKIGEDFRFHLLSKSELKTYFVLFNEEIVEMCDHLEDLILIYGRNHLNVKLYSTQIGFRMMKLGLIWENYSFIDKPTKQRHVCGEREKGRESD